jgi:hypothetical protein
VFEGVDQTRALLLTKEYLLDVVQATSAVPHTYDYVLHSFGREWYEHKAKLRLRMAADPQTLVMHGVWGHELATLVSERDKGAKLDQLSTVVARRTGQREALFVTSHEPYSGTDQPQLTRVVTLGRTKGAAAIRVDAKDFTDC